MKVGQNYSHDILDPLNDELIDVNITNTWKQELENIELSELIEVFTINVTAPFILNTKLKPLMMRNNPDN